MLYRTRNWLYDSGLHISVYCFWIDAHWCPALLDVHVRILINPGDTILYLTSGRMSLKHNMFHQ